jgi:hypothetical protein
MSLCEKFVMKPPAALTFTAAAAYSSHVFGTAIPLASNRSVR